MALENNLFVPVSISEVRDIRTLAAPFEVDSNYGRWPDEVASKNGSLVIGGRGFIRHATEARRSDGGLTVKLAYANVTPVLPFYMLESDPPAKREILRAVLLTLLRAVLA